MHNAMSSPSTPDASPLARAAALYATASSWAELLAPVANVALRLWVGYAFWISGLSKIQTWDSTVLLFTYEYHVPLLPPLVAAISGTFTELFFPWLLGLGILTRFAGFVLFVFNIIAVVSYPDLGPAGLAQHLAWGLALFFCWTHGGGVISLDWLLGRLVLRR